MSAYATAITISRFPKGKMAENRPAYGVHAHGTWGELCDQLRQRREGEKDGQCFAAATFALEPGYPPEQEVVRRLKANVTSRTLIALDIEKNKKTGEVPPAMADAVEDAAENGWACAAYTSHNHKPDADVRYRLILPLTAAVDPALPCPEVVAHRLGLGGVLDTSKVGASSLFYLPSCEPGQADRHECILQDGGPLNADRLTGAAFRLHQARVAEQERIAAEAHKEAVARRAERLAAGFDPDDSLIDRLRAHYDLAAVLEAHRYDRAGKKFRHPNSSSMMHGADIKMIGGIERVFSHNATDPLHADNLPAWCGTVTALDVVDVVTILDFAGDRRRALRELAERHGLNKTEERRQLARLLFRLRRKNAPQHVIEQKAYAAAAGLRLTKQDVFSVAQWVAEQPQKARAA